jgi:hypothetical protein
MARASWLALLASSAVPEVTIGAGTVDVTINAGTVDEAGLTRIVFASCKDGAAGSAAYAGNNLSFDWSLVSKRAPHAFVWAGDAVYADHPPPRRSLGWPLRLFLPDFPVRVDDSAFHGAEPAELQAMYSSLLAEPGYASLTSSVRAVVGTWDDHDYGLDDADRTFVHRDASKRLFLDFLGATTCLRPPCHTIYLYLFLDLLGAHALTLHTFGQVPRLMTLPSVCSSTFWVRQAAFPSLPPNRSPLQKNKENWNPVTFTKKTASRARAADAQWSKNWISFSLLERA